VATVTAGVKASITPLDMAATIHDPAAQASDDAGRAHLPGVPGPAGQSLRAVLRH
jgi:hypothetical protein